MKTSPATSKTQENDIGGFSLKVSVFVVTLAAALIPLGLNSYISYKETTTQVVTTANDTLLKSNQSSAKLVKAWLDGNEVAVRSAAVSSDIISMEDERTKPQLISLNKKMPVFFTLNLLNPQGMQVSRSSPDKLITVADRGYYKTIRDGADISIESGISRANNKPFIAFGAPVMRDSQLVGVLTALAIAEPIADQVTGGKIGRTGISYLVDTTSSIILAHPDVKRVGEKLEDAGRVKVQRTVFGKSIDGLSQAKTPIKYTSSAVGAGLVLVSEINQDEISEPIREAQMKAVGFLGGALALAALLSYLLATSISGKISRLASAVTDVSRAKTQAQIQSLEEKIGDVGGARELRLIARSILRLTASIKLALQSM